MFTVYHLPEMEKVGCTNDFARRMKEQGFEPLDEYRKSVHDTIEAASLAEETLRKFYKYKEDSSMTYAEKFAPSGKSGVKTWTKSHYVGYNELSKGASKEALRESLSKYDSISLTTKGGTWVFSTDDYDQLVKLAAVSQHRDFYWGTKNLNNFRREQNKPTAPCSHGNNIPEFQQIRDWAEDKGIFASGDPKTQYIKLQEEAGEVAKALLNQDEEEIIDGLGDTLVVLINLSHLAGYRLEDCLASAYDVIKKRKGKMENGTFIKETL